MTRPRRLTVFGTGYLGITHAACMASLGFEVLGVDIDTAKVDKLSAGVAPISFEAADTTPVGRWRMPLARPTASS